MQITYYTTRVALPHCVHCALYAVLLIAPSIAWAADDKKPQAKASSDTPDPASNLRRPQSENASPLKSLKRTGSDMTLVDGPPIDKNVALLGPPDVVELRRRMEELQKAQQQFASEYQNAMKDLQASLPRTVQMDIKRQEVKQKMEAAQAEMAAISIAQGQATGAPLPENAVLRAFPLKYVKPEDIGQALHNITGGGGPRIAVDERTNALLIAGNEKQISVAEQLVQTLDQPGKSQQAKTPEVIQVRIVWLSEGMTDRVSDPPQSSIVSPQVVDALHELGMDQPQVVCQQLTSLTLGPTDRRAQFHFRIPTQVEDSTWEFQGEGTVTPTADDRYPEERYAMDFNLSLTEPNVPNPLSCQVGGSILTPLGHYTVMGTTTFVAPQSQPDKGKVQRLSAFVVYLDRPKEFSDSNPKAKPTKKSE